jgi:hypothetical protein
MYGKTSKRPGALEDLKRVGVWLIEQRQPDPENNADEQRRQRTQIIVTEAAENRSQRVAPRHLRLNVTKPLNFRRDRLEPTERMGEIGRDPHRFVF